MALELQRQLTDGHDRREGASRGPVGAAEPDRWRSGPPSVEVRNACRSFGGRTVLAGVDLSIEPGEFVALLGRSGAGKSTLLRALAGLDQETTGISSVPERRAVVFQDARLLPWARVLENVSLGLRAADASERARRALGEVGLGGHEQSWPGTLSGGEAQRTALARALVREPQLLLLDEPFGALDALTRIQMHELLGELCARHEPAVLLVTHDVDEALLLADRVLVMADGHIATERQIDLGAPRHRQQLGFAELRTDLLGALGVTEVVDTGEGRLHRPVSTDATPINWKEHVS